MSAGRPGALLQSQVARRLMLLFVACALVPLGALAGITLYRTSQQLEEQAARRLTYDVKAASLDALGRLELQAKTLRVMGVTLALQQQDVDTLRGRIDELLPHRPPQVTFVPESGPPTPVIGDPLDVTLTDVQRDHLARFETLIWTSDDLRRSVLVVAIDAGRVRGHMLMPLDLTVLFGLDGWDVLPPNSDLCVLTVTRQVLACSPGAPATTAAQLQDIGLQELIQLEGAGGSLLARSREVPLQAAYGANSWIAVIMRPRSVVFGPIELFTRDFWRLSLLALLVVVWLSLTQVRRQMRPLDSLMQATRRIAARDFSTPVEVSSGDEFEDLGHSFNDLASALRHHFDELEAFSSGTLEALARTIDAKSPWTAGHSGRVTELALRIAREMALPPDEILQIRRGGLVHDIGKLATPPGILDKPAPLTPEQEAIMRQHPTQGMHILEPIPAFRDILPIVGQHHERWDGTGYPQGLSGTAIARIARVLSVADVFDAMRSDRPYRPGVPLANVVSMIEAGSGSRFDPEVVAAFLAVMRRDAAGRAPVPRSA